MNNKKIKKVLILGASSEIGIAIIKKYLNEKYEILAHYNQGNNLFFKLVKDNKNIHSFKFDFLKSFFKLEKLVKNRIFKNCDVLINALGYLKEIDYTKVKIRNIENALKVNFYPSFLFTQILGKKMLEKKWGRIVHLGSIGVKYGGGEKNLPYAFSKHSLEFFPSYVQKWASKNVLVNTVRVGLTDTKLHLKLKSKNMKQRVNLVPLKRMADKKEIANFVFFLGSDRNSYISNQVIRISGGE
jgi:3-oxoacyl-[acyl-carrier protein] reductase